MHGNSWQSGSVLIKRITPTKSGQSEILAHNHSIGIRDLANQSSAIIVPPNEEASSRTRALFTSLSGSMKIRFTSVAWRLRASDLGDLT
jgi:hypothetical protein